MAITRFRRRHATRSVSTKKQPKSKQTQAPSPWGRESHMQSAQKRVDEKKEDKRWQHELKEMKETHDLDEVDDDVEAATTLYEWHAEEHEHRPKSPVWFALLAAGTTIIVSVLLLIYNNVFGAVTIAFAGGLMYYIAQQEPSMMRYRIMLDGVAMNTTMYHWQDLGFFNIIYEPDETKTVIFKSNRLFSPYIHMEVGDADPVQIREILIEFVEEDQEIQEPMVDIIARRLGF